jgi:prepilin-type N-terminal cleavage/methylation domain-containing protein
MLTRLAHTLTRLRDTERGFTLVELLIAATIGLAVVGGAVAAFSVSARSQPRVADRAGDIQQARSTIEQITRELRQGSTVTNATSNQLSIVTYVNSAACGGAQATGAIQCRVDYYCSSGACTRTERNADGTGGGPAVTVVSGLTGSAVFTFSPSSTDPTFVGVELTFPARDGDDSISLGDGVSLRNTVASS